MCAPLDIAVFGRHMNIFMDNVINQTSEFKLMKMIIIIMMNSYLNSLLFIMYCFKLMKCTIKS